MIPKRDKTTDIASEVAQGKMFRGRLTKLVEEITTRFIEKNENLNTLVAEVAKRESFNQLQIQRLVEETNTIAYNKRYNQEKKNNDRRISFELAELSRVLEVMGDAAPPKEENPNFVAGKGGEGELTKSASFDGIETTPIHNPNMKVSQSRQRLLEKQASLTVKEDTKKLQRLEKDIQSDIFKIANNLVMTEKMYKEAANQTFNTMISDVALDEVIVEGIQKKASEIAQHLKNTGRTYPNFDITLEVDHMRKVANVFLGEHSLIKQASDSTKVEQPKVVPTVDISDYQQLINLAQNIQQKQLQANSLDSKLKPKTEVKNDVN